MFQLRYNALSFVSVGLGVANSLLMMRVFGVSSMADAFLIASNILASLQFIQLMFIEQFMFFYQDRKVADPEDALAFYRAVVTFSLISGLVITVLLALAAEPVLRVFAYRLDAERFGLLKQLYVIMIVGSVVDAVSTVNQRLLNAEMRFSVPYLLSMVQLVFSTFILGYLVFFRGGQIELLAWGRTIGGLVSCLAGFVVLRRLGLPYQFSLRHPSLFPLLRNSVAMRFGYNIHNILISPVTNNILATLPGGNASCFYYAQRLHQMIGNVAVSPSYSILHARIAKFWSEENRAAIGADIRKFLFRALPLFGGASLIGYLLVPELLPQVTKVMQPAEVQLIQQLFLALVPWYLVALLESPFLSVCIASKQSTVFIATNLAFIFAYLLLSVLVVGWLAVYTVPVTMFLAQLINLTTFFIYSRFLLSAQDAGRVSGML